MRWLTETEQQTWRGFLAMQAQLGAQLNRQLQADSQLSESDFAVLVALTDRPDARVRVLELARELEWEKSRLSHHLGRMRRRGLITRQECPSDARGAFVVLTRAGREAIEAAAPPHVETVRRLVFDALTAEQIATFGEITQRVLGRIEAERR
ncbi:MAG TPA: MarR family transcriptional regulator [Amycolatopsis sp.]|nr:MarR family transcriptional regulator [Amycolatopsis sp.]